MAQQDLKVDEMIEAFDYLMYNKGSRIQIPRQMVEDIESGAKKLRLRMSDFIGVYDAGVRNDMEVVFFGNSNNELL